jgi:hypothetical protein
LRLSDIIFFWNRDRGSRWQVYSKGALCKPMRHDRTKRLESW